jgi:hypothetical protein
VIEDEPLTDRRQPAAGGLMHPEVERILRQHGLLIGWSPNTVTPVKSAQRREAEEQRARAGHQPGQRSITDLHRGAMRTLGAGR